MSFRVTVNGTIHTVFVPEDMPLLWILRDVLPLTGTKFGCGAVDCGMVVNPDMVRAQFEGGVVFGLSAVLHHALTFEGGRAVERSFSSYPLVVLDEAPEVDVAIVPSAAKPGGVGEPPVPPLAPAVANAIFSATGRRYGSYRWCSRPLH